MSNLDKLQADRRSLRTQALIFNAFSELVQTRRYDSFRVSDIIDRAGIGRSTFYDHYSNKDEVLVASMAGPLTILASTLSGESDIARLQGLLSHFWERRAVARTILAPPMLHLIASRLADLIAQGSQDSIRRLSAINLAFGVLAVIENWLSGRTSIKIEDLSIWLCTLNPNSE